MGEIVLMGDPAVSRVPVEDCSEPLVDARDRPFLRVDEREADPEGAWRLVRAGVADRLEAAARLLPSGVFFLLVEGYRPAPLQQRYFAGYAEELRACQPDLTADALHLLASRYVSPPEIAPHTAGAAVDLTLCRDDGTELWMGTRINASPEESNGACYTDAAGIGAEARAHRKILMTALHTAGLVNYPTEWWHWSYGDRYWALRSGQPHAVYGPARAPIRS